MSGKGVGIGMVLFLFLRVDSRGGSVFIAVLLDPDGVFGGRRVGIGFFVAGHGC
jgi:hypothetical protein